MNYLFSTVSLLKLKQKRWIYVFYHLCFRVAHVFDYIVLFNKGIFAGPKLSRIVYVHITYICVYVSDARQQKNAINSRNKNKSNEKVDALPLHSSFSLANWVLEAILLRFQLILKKQHFLND